MADERIVHLNVGGVCFSTRSATLTSSDSFFAGAMRAHPNCSELFVDRDPTHFRYILNWMRGVRYLPDDEQSLAELAYEADYFCIPAMKEAIVRVKSKSNIGKSLREIQAELRRK